MPRGGKKSIYETPFIVRAFDKHIKNWSSSQGMILVKPRTTILKNVIFRSAALGLLDTKWYVTAIYEPVGEGHMDKEAVRLYRRLKGMECQLEVRGLLRKKMFFKPHRNLMALKSYIPTLEVSDEFCQALNQNDEIMGLLRALNPSEMAISLHSIPAEHQQPDEPPVTSIETTTPGAVIFFKNPSSITWLITLSSMFMEGPGVQRKADKVFQLFSQVCRVIKEEMKRVQET